ncbi:hypothetical protein ALT721_1540018 [Alteromonas alvinellae]
MKMANIKMLAFFVLYTLKRDGVIIEHYKQIKILLRFCA